MRLLVGDCCLNEVLAEKGWSQQDLADRVPMKKQQVSEFATNKRKMSIANLFSIAKTLGVSPYRLYKLTPDTSELAAEE